MKLRLLLISLASLLCLGTSAKIVVKKSVEHNLRYQGAYVVFEKDSVTYSYVDDETGNFVSLMDASGDTGFDIGFYVNHSNGESEFVHENPFSFFPSDGDRVGYADLDLVDGKYTTNDYSSLTDSFKIAKRGDWQTVWVSETEPLYLQNIQYFQLTEGYNNVIAENTGDDNYNALDVKDGQYLYVLDGETLNTYRLTSGLQFSLQNDTICLGNDAKITIHTDCQDFYCDVNISNSSNYYSLMFKDTSIINIPFSEEGLYYANVYVGTYTTTKHFVQKGSYVFNREIYVKDCMPKCKDPYYPVHLSADKWEACVGDSVLIRLNNWWNVKYDTEASNTIINYTFYDLNNTDSISNAFKNDSTIYIKLKTPGRHLYEVRRTDICGNTSSDTISIMVTDCETGCSSPELSENVRLLINSSSADDTICHRDISIVTIENWDRIQKESNGNVNYTLEIQPDGRKIDLVDGYWSDTFGPGLHNFKVTRTDACGRVSIDSIFRLVRPELPRLDVSASSNKVCEGEDILFTINNWREVENISSYAYYYVKELESGKIFYFNNDTCRVKTTDLHSVFGTYRLDVYRNSYCGNDFYEFAIEAENCPKECPKDTVHIKPLSFDIVKNGTCDFSLVYTLKDKDGCDLYYAIDLDMENCNNNEDEGDGVINLTVDGNYVYFDEETKVSIFSIDGRKVFDGKFKSVKLDSGIYIITTANAYRKVIIKE